MQTKTKAHLAVLGANLIFGVNFSVVKYITPALIKPFGLNVVRVVVTTALFWIMLKESAMFLVLRFQLGYIESTEKASCSVVTW